MTTIESQIDDDDGIRAPPSTNIVEAQVDDDITPPPSDIEDDDPPLWRNIFRETQVVVDVDLPSKDVGVKEDSTTFVVHVGFPPAAEVVVEVDVSESSKADVTLIYRSREVVHVPMGVFAPIREFVMKHVEDRKRAHEAAADQDKIDSKKKQTTLRIEWNLE